MDRAQFGEAIRKKVAEGSKPSLLETLYDVEGKMKPVLRIRASRELDPSLRVYCRLLIWIHPPSPEIQ